MKRAILTLLIFCLAVPVAYADEGMWLFDAAPKQQIYEKYGFQLTDAWLEHVQKSTARFARRGTASFVSPQGLIFTNHHVGARVLHDLSTPENNLLADGFYARTLEEEKPVPGLEILVTKLSIDVTERVNAGITAGITSSGLTPAAHALTPDEARRMRTAAIAEIEREYTESTGLRCEVTTLFHGGMYKLYGYKVYDDIRLVWAPEESIGAFGGDPDNYEFPRYCVDAMFLRAYVDGRPAQIEHYLKWNFDGIQEGELVFAAGFPGRTERSFTREHLEFQRDVFFPWRFQKLFRREVNYAVFASKTEENHRRITDTLTSLQNQRKRGMGQLLGLQTPSLWRDDLPSAAREPGTVSPDSGDSPEQRIKEALQAARENHLYVAYDLIELGEAFNSQTFRIARNLVRLAIESEKPNEDRLPAFRDDRLAATRASILSDAPIHEDVEIMMLTDSLTMLFETQQFLMVNTSPSKPTFFHIFGERSPREVAVELIRGSRVRDIVERQRFIDGGWAAIEGCGDPMIVLARELEHDARVIREEYQTLVEAPLTAAYAELAQQRFEQYGMNIWPDATFTVRLSYGIVKGHIDGDGNHVPPFTYIAGLFDRAEQQGFRPPWLPAQTWLDAKDTLDMTIPFNFISTLDTVGGNSGSPVINTRGEVVGTVFDGNIYSLPNLFVFPAEQGRTVSVHAAVVIETLRKINQDTRILAELGWSE